MNTILKNYKLKNYKNTWSIILSDEDRDRYIDEIAMKMAIPKSYLEPPQVSCSTAPISEDDFEKARISYYGA